MSSNPKFDFSVLLLCLQFSYTLNKMYYRFTFHPWGMFDMTTTRKNVPTKKLNKSYALK